MRPLEPISPDDRHLLGAIAAGDEAAFDTFYANTAPAVARFAWSLVASRDGVEELLQETFLTAWRKPGSVRLINGSVLPWLLVTCRNHARNRARRDRRRREASRRLDESAALDPSNGEAVLQLRWALDSIASLPDTDRMVCELVLLQGHSYREAAAHLSISEASVGKRLHRARQQLKKDAI